MRRMCLAISLTAALAVPAAAQSPVFVTGALFGDLKRFSGDPATNVLNGDSVGGGGRLGAFVAPQWTLELGVDAGASTTALRDSPLPAVKGMALPALRQSRTRNRLIATTVLVGFHPSTRRHVQFGYFGGLTLLRVTRRSDTLIAGVAQPNEREVIDLVPAATMAAEARVGISQHLAIVPEIRVLTFSLSPPAPAGFAIRPGVALRWTF
jgi:hypothetical protein